MQSRSRQRNLTGLMMFLDQGGASAPPLPLIPLSLAEYSHDKVIFDSGLQVGAVGAPIPFSVSTDPGTLVEARVVALDGGDGTTVWTALGMSDENGDIGGEIEVPTNTTWFRREVRLADYPSIKAVSSGRFASGHVIAIWGQSEPYRIILPFASQTTPPPVQDDDALQVFIGAADTPARVEITDAQPFTAACAEMSNTFAREMPGIKVALVFHTVSGTDPRELVNDSNPARSWAADKALHDFATADGQRIGAAAMSWFAAPGSLGSSYGEALFPLFAGKTLGGITVTFPTDVTYGAGSTYHADHWFGELYDYAWTRWIPYGPHKFDIGADMQDATHLASDGSIQTQLYNKQAARLSWREMLDNIDATMFLPLGTEPLLYSNGYASGGTWVDYSHPTAADVNGVPAYARETACAIMASLGVGGIFAPEIDNAYWEPSGAYVEVWDSLLPITTVRLNRGLPPLDATFPHWTEVMGFQINGEPAKNVQIVAGRIRIYPNHAGNFLYTDSISYGEGGASGMLKFPEDYPAETWMNLPIALVGNSGIAEVTVRPLPGADVLANTLPAPQFFSSSTPGPYFADTANIPAGTSALTWHVKFRVGVLPVSGSGALFSLSGIHCDGELLNNGNLRFTVKDSANVTVINNRSIVAGIAPNTWYDIVVSVDHATKKLIVQENGVEIGRINFATPGSGLFSSARYLGFLRQSNGAKQFVGDIGMLRVWRTANAEGGIPAAASHKTITGGLGVVALDPWFHQDAG